MARSFPVPPLSHVKNGSVKLPLHRLYRNFTQARRCVRGKTRLRTRSSVAASPRFEDAAKPGCLFNSIYNAGNMVALLPPELLALIQQKCPCREAPARQLATFYNVRRLRPI
jgi:hypothetical protein